MDVGLQYTIQYIFGCNTIRYTATFWPKIRYHFFLPIQQFVVWLPIKKGFFILTYIYLFDTLYIYKMCQYAILYYLKEMG